MYQEEFTAVGQASVGKVGFLRNNPIGYIIASMLAGIYVGFGILLVFSIGGQLDGAIYTKLIMGASFGVALSLVILAGAELFTGNNFVMTSGLLQKKVSLSQTIKLWIFCFFGNWIGAIIISFIFIGTGLADGNAIATFMIQTAQGKMTAGALALFLRGVLCNMLVCLAVWCGFRCKSESGKLIMIFWCLFAFFTSSFEHSIANMTLLTTALCLDADGILTMQGYFYNLFFVTLGNMVGGILCLAIPYAIMANKKEV
mgnify:CR=1 FL=1